MRKGLRYWGPALITVGVMIAAAAGLAWKEFPTAMWWGFSIAALLLIAGGSIVAATRQDL